MKNLGDELTKALAEEDVEDADKLETVRTLIHNNSHRCTSDESGQILRDLFAGAGMNSDVSKSVTATVAPPMKSASGESKVAYTLEKRRRIYSEDCLLSVKEVVEVLGISSRHVWRLVAAGELARPIRLGRACRWVYVDVTKYIERLKGERNRGAS